MPLFSSKESTKSSTNSISPNNNNNSLVHSKKIDEGIANQKSNKAAVTTPSAPSLPPPQKFVFRCQQAHGSPTGLISGFSNVKELYQKIAECYGFPVGEIIFCTLNTYRVDMDALLSAQLSLDDFIFVHVKGTKKEVEIVKTEDALGLTITDNGTGYSFIKRIKDGSIVKNTGVIQAGDHIERIDGENVVGWRHIEVAKYLRSIPVGRTFTIRLIEPLRAGFANIGPNAGRKQKPGTGQGSYGSGKETLRFRGSEPVRLEVHDDAAEIPISKINNLLENFMGISDVDLATQVWELASGRESVMEFAEAIDTSELESFGFSDSFIIEVWGIITKSSLVRRGNN